MKTKGGPAGASGHAKGWLLLMALVALGGAASCGDRDNRGDHLTPGAVARYAVLRSSCDSFQLPPNSEITRLYNPPSELVTASYRAALQRHACFAETVRGCEGLSSCLGSETQTFSALPCEAPAYCEGATRVACSETLDGRFARVQANCAAGGLACAEGQCVDPAAKPPCDGAAFDSRCEGDSPVFCAGGVEQVGLACSTFGRACLEGVGVDTRFAGALCGGKGPACERRRAAGGGPELQGLGCEGARLRECVAGDKEALVDCGVWVEGASCQQAANEASGEVDYFCGVASDCNPFSTEPTCDGGAIVVCNGGRFEHVDCGALGLGPCETTAGRATCKAPVRARDEGYLTAVGGDGAAVEVGANPSENRGPE